MGSGESEEDAREVDNYRSGRASSEKVGMVELVGRAEAAAPETGTDLEVLRDSRKK
jgi:hypothetical protein